VNVGKLFKQRKTLRDEIDLQRVATFCFCFHRKKYIKEGLRKAFQVESKGKKFLNYKKDYWDFSLS
jgi:hypothetical protein